MSWKSLVLGMLVYYVFGFAVIWYFVPEAFTVTEDPVVWHRTNVLGTELALGMLLLGYAWLTVQRWRRNR